MTETVPSSSEEHEVSAIEQLLWGNEIKDDIFSRWSQGFFFSNAEPTALEQQYGGPCSVIAPVQAFIIKNLLKEFPNLDSFRNNVPESKQNEILAKALWEVLCQCSKAQFRMATITANINGDAAGARDDQCTTSSAEQFNRALRITVLADSLDCLKFIEENIEDFKAHFGILLFVYSVIATKGVTQVQLESDTNDPLIDETYGYGSQSLINLMITGRAVTYVWDHEQDVGGLKLRGLDKQSEIGFVTLMEHMRYCTVGSFFKNPKHPVWVLGSETHLTVLFSSNRRLVSPETKSEEARRVFKNYDKDGNNFINADDLQNVLADLQLVSDEGYVKIIRKKLDSENLGIILLNAFMDEFFPKEECSTPDTFQLVHYNGLAQSNANGQVKYKVGTAILLETNYRGVCESNPMLTCLQTKWPTIDVNWMDDSTPSLN